ncbi:non classical export pathway protein [Schizosaccharomyces japonicus yFS275]|uniref:Non classical export pathway protein n=1 Tax=Schizosaccharomyces japonicus (strain yFS275 / FY16936) TaxID=402676 RepID=B6K272_SCHJY|nr:non classical export pathway protein [Schizosaccharomyces japonicus yFS275]EEB07253.1 non classical export pathway protein [Schizosaccharomyces japonicus yFS275]
MVKQYGLYTWLMRPAQLITASIVLGLSAALVDQQTTGGSPPRINFAVAVGCISIICFFITAFGVFLPNILGHPWFISALDFINMILCLAGGVALAVAIRVHACNNQPYLDANRYTQGSGKRCRELKALTFFLWWLFALYFVSWVVQFFIAKQNIPSSTYKGRKRGPAVAPRPAVSAV